MVKKTKTMAATLKQGKKFTQKPKAPRTSTMQQTLNSKDAGFKKQQKSRKTKTMAQTLKQGAANKTKTIIKKKASAKKGKVVKKGGKGKAQKK